MEYHAYLVSILKLLKSVYREKSLFMKLILNCGQEIEFDFLDNVWITKVDTKQEAITLNKYRK